MVGARLSGPQWGSPILWCAMRSCATLFKTPKRPYDGRSTKGQAAKRHVDLDLDETGKPRTQLRSRLHRLRTFVVNFGFAVIFLVYPASSGAVFRTFSCDTFDTGRTFLRADYSIDCDSGAHQMARAYAWAMLGVWVGGAPLLYCGILWHYRSNIRFVKRLEKETVGLQRRSGGAPIPAKVRRRYGIDAAAGSRARQLSATSAQQLKGNVRNLLPSYVLALTDAYEEDYFWWEVPEALRKLSFVGLLIFYRQGSLEQLVLGLVLCIASTSAYHNLKPYEAHADDLLQWICQAQPHPLLQPHPPYSPLPPPSALPTAHSQLPPQPPSSQRPTACQLPQASVFNCPQPPPPHHLHHVHPPHPPCPGDPSS